MKLCDKTFL